MLLFAISFILVFASSYLITSLLDRKNSTLGLIYLFLIFFAQVVLTFEALSLFNAIKQNYVIGSNVLVLAISLFAWNKNSRPLWRLSCEDFKNKVINSFKLDKSLLVLFFAYSIFIISAIFLCLIMPITSGDAGSYHVSRSLFWLLQGSLNHFEIADIRNLCLPINSEIIYAWIMLFIKKDLLLSCLSFFGYLLSMIALYNILGLGGFCTRKKLWVIFILSSFSSVLVQASGTETDIIISGLVLSSIFLFWTALKNDEKTPIPIFMASLAYALAIGTKTTSLFMIPGVGLLMIGLCFKFKKYKPLVNFIGFGILNFIIFSSYNYILNFIHFGNFMGSENFMVVSKNYYGIKGMFANFIKYIFMFLDFTGFRWSDYIGDDLLKIRTTILTFLHLNYVKDGFYSTGYNFQRTLIEPMMGAGILGFLVYLPNLLWATIKPIFKYKYKKIRFIFVFAALFIINLFILSYNISFMTFSVRFIMALLVLSAPVLLYSYLSKKNPLKYIIIIFAVFYLVFVSTHLWARPVVKITKILRKNPSISHLRRVASCEDYEANPLLSNGACVLADRIRKNFNTKNKILAFINTGDSIFYIKRLNFEGYNIDIARLEDISNIDFNKYNLVVTTSEGQLATHITQYEERKNDYVMESNNLIQKKKRPVPCIYKYNPDIPKYSDGKLNAPFQSICMLNNEFAKNNDLKVIGKTGVIKPLESSYIFYIILENAKHPAILKLNTKRN